MKREKVVAFFLSLAIHLIIFSLIWWLLQKSEEKNLSASSSKRVDISLQDFITPTQKPKPLEASPQRRPTKEQKPKVPVKTKERVEKREKASPKQEKPKTLKEKAAKREKKATMEKEVPAPKKVSAPKPKIEKAEKDISPKEAEKKVEKREEVEEKRSPLSKLAGALGAPAIPQSEPSPPSIAKINDALFDREFKALYKDDFDRFTPEQKKFIKDNLSRIQGITQHYLTLRGYPYIAARLGQSGMNIVEFDLHPNGDITNLKVIKGSESEILDKNSLDTIKTAYKDYPRPKEVTKIRFYIYYRLY